MVRYTIEKSDEVEEHQEPEKAPAPAEKGEPSKSDDDLSEGFVHLDVGRASPEPEGGAPADAPPEADLKAIARRVAKVEGDVRESAEKQLELGGRMVRMENWLHGSMDAVMRKLDAVIADQQKSGGSWAPLGNCNRCGNSWPRRWQPPTLLQAAECGDAEALLRMLADGGARGDPEQRCVTGDTALHAAATRGHARCARLLLAAGASPRALGGRLRAPLHAAAFWGHTDVARALLDAGAEVDCRDVDGVTPLALAAATGVTNMVALLLERGAAHDAADSKGLTPAFYAATTGRESVLLMLLDRGASLESRGGGEGGAGAGVSLVAHAARAGQWGVVRLLMDRGARTARPPPAAAAAAAAAPEGEGEDAKGKAPPEDSALVLAARAGQGAALRQLLRRKADAFDDEEVEAALNAAATACAVWALAEAAPDAVRGEAGKWALLYAAEDGRLEAVMALMEAGVDVASARDGSGITALHTAAWNGHWLVVRLLLVRGADCAWKDSNGDTPLHKAALADRAECVRVLLQLGATDALAVQNKQGATPRDLAASEAVRRMLVEGVVASEYAFAGSRKYTYGYPAAQPSATAAGGTLFGAAAATGGTRYGASAGATAFGSAASSGTTFGTPGSSGTTFGAPGSSGTTFGAPGSSGTTFGAPGSSGTTFGAPGSSRTTFGASASSGTTFGASASSGTTFGAPGSSGTSFGVPASSGTTFGVPASGQTTFGAQPVGEVLFNIPLTTGGTFGAPTFTGPTLGANSSGSLSFGAPLPDGTTFGGPAPTGLFEAASGNSPSKAGLFGSVSEPSSPVFGFSSDTPAVASIYRILDHAIGNGENDSLFGSSEVAAVAKVISSNMRLEDKTLFGCSGGNAPTPGNISGLGSQPSSNSGNIRGPNARPVNVATGNQVEPPNSRTLFGGPVTAGKNISKVGKCFGTVNQTVPSSFPFSYSLGNAKFPIPNPGQANSLFGTVQPPTSSTVNLGGAKDATPPLSSGETGNPFMNAAGNNTLGSVGDKGGRADNKTYSVYSGNTAKNTTSSGGVQPANSTLNGGTLKRSPPEEDKEGAVSDSSTSTSD